MSDAVAIQFDNIPAQLRELPQWVRWRIEPRVEGEAPTKIPYRVCGGSRAKSNDPTTWGRFDIAVQWLANDNMLGIGFCFATNGGLVGIDLDGCRNPETGTIDSWATEILDRFQATYAEVSPSQKGIKICCRGRLKTDRTGKRVKLPGSHCGIEAYHRARFFTVTGQLVAGHPSVAADCQEAIDWLWSKWIKPNEPAERQPAKVDPSRLASLAGDRQQILKRAMAYLGKLPPAVQGQNGSGATFRAACELYRFGLEDSEARLVLGDFNARCEPPWSDSELEHKLEDARDEVHESGEFGVRLLEESRNGNGNGKQSHNGKGNGKPNIQARSIGPTGAMVQAGDRDNWGTVIQDDGDTCLVRFVSTDGKTAEKQLPKSELRDQDGKSLTQRADSPPPRFVNLITSRGLLDLDLRPEYLVRGILVKGQPAVIGGRSKTLKTSIAIDLAVSLAGDSRFLDRFEVTKQHKVAVWSGESGAATLRETAIRIANSKKIDLADCDLSWCFDLPKIGRFDHIESLEAVITESGFDVIFIDPLYLSLLDISTANLAGNVYAMGSLLQPVAELGQRTQCTIIVLHHFRKSGGPTDDKEPASLEMLSQAGITEWARQWLLLDRRTAYAADGRHELYLRAGGSAGHAGLWAVDVDEGVLDDETMEGRRWQVELRSIGDVHAETKRTTEKRRMDELEARDTDDRRRIQETLRQFHDGETMRAIRELSGLSNDRAGKAIRVLIGDGLVESFEVKKHTKTYTAYRTKGV